MPVPERALAAVGDQHWLDRTAEPLQRGLTLAFEAVGTAGQQIKNFLHGTWLGHPLHPVMTDVPVGAWSAAMVLDAMSSANGGHLDRAADAAIGVGIVGAVGAAVTGLTDWQHVQ